VKIKAFIKNAIIKCDAQLWRQYLSGFDGEVSIEIKKWQRDRTLDQNALYWKYISIICSHTGDNIDDTHEYFKRKFLPPRFVTVLGQKIRLPASSKKLSTKEFTDYLDQICALTGVPIPSHNNI